MPLKQRFTALLVASLLLALAAQGAVSDIALVNLLRQGQYNAVIQHATTQINDRASNPTMYYLRGMAYWNTGQFANAAADFGHAGNDAPWRNWTKPADYLRKYAVVRKTLPANSRTIMNGEQVQFRVYYDTLTPGTEDVIAQLPKAAAIGRELLHTELMDMSVYILPDQQQFRRFFRAWMNSDPQPWQFAGGGCGVLLFTELPANTPRGSRLRHKDYLASLVAHEYTHCILREHAGSIPVPSWFEEGLAMVAGSKGSPDDLAYNDACLRRLFARDGILSYRDLTRNFYQSYASSRMSGGKTDAYEQGFSMVRHLLTSISTEQLADIVRQTRTAVSFEQAFTEVTGMTTEQFYNAWHQTMRDRIATSPTPQQQERGS